VKNFPASLSVVTLLLFSSCETTDTGYGYVANGLDEDSIVELVELSDEAINERQYEIYSGLFAPGYHSLDRSQDMAMNGTRIGRFEYLDLVRDIFKHAKEILVYSTITDIEIVEPGVKAIVKIQEDGLLDYQGDRKRVVSISEVEVGYEDGWIFFESSTTIARKDIKE